MFTLITKFCLSYKLLFYFYLNWIILVSSKNLKIMSDALDKPIIKHIQFMVGVHLISSYNLPLDNALNL